MVKCVCDPISMGGHTYNQFFGTVFQVCAYSPRDIIGFICGLINILIWLGAQVPQLIESYKNKSGGNISLAFLLIWLVGDVGNILGCYLTNQSAVQRYTSVYFIVMDLLVLGQILYYAKFYKKAIDHIQPEEVNSGHSHNQLEHVDINDDPSTPLSPGGRRKYGSTHIPSTTIIAICFTLFLTISGVDSRIIHTLSTQLRDTSPSMMVTHALSFLQDNAPICNDMGSISEPLKIFGTACAWVCGLLYLTARIPQCWKNYKMKTTKGISFLLFAMSFTANWFYAISILLPNTTDFKSVGFWKDTFPYLVGSIGANVFSFIVMVQFWIYPSLPDDHEQEEKRDVSADINDDDAKNLNAPIKNEPVAAYEHPTHVLSLEVVENESFNDSQIVHTVLTPAPNEGSIQNP